MPATSPSRPLLRGPYIALGALLALAMVCGQLTMAVIALRDHSAQAALYFLICAPITGLWCVVAATALPSKLRNRLAGIWRVRVDPTLLMVFYGFFAAAAFAFGFK